MAKPTKAKGATKAQGATKAKAASSRRSRPKQLAKYRAMRDFDATSEPSGDEAPQPGHRFVVQRHRARRLHYDLRLELDGVLVSWAVPKGPTLDPKSRRMAVHVEDHPLAYADFEGVIPEGSYGGGDVIVWDRGTWVPDGDPAKALAKGDLHFDLEGEKLRGRFALVRRAKDAGGKEQWLLIHKDDEHAERGWDPEDHPVSVKSGRTNDEVAAAPSATWSSAAEWAAPTDDELAELDALGKGGEWELGGHTLRLTNLDKVLFPAGGGHRRCTKRDLIRHYATVAPAILPYLAGRPVNLHRYPDGISKPGFWHKAAPDHAPDFIRRWRNEEADPGETEVYSVLDSPAAVAWAANFGAIELHPWTSTAEHPHEPTWAMIDIDPGTKATFDDALVLARLYRTALEHLEVRACPKVTGKRGIQIWVPVAPGYSFDDTRAWVERLSRAIGKTVPEMVSWEWETSKRRGLTRLDYTQNAINKTLVAPFSVRPAPGAPVSVPITWDELDDEELASGRWTIDDIGERLASSGDPLAPLVGVAQRLPRL
jgi:bifunctional non-homologous end joining protein LigD